MFGFGRKKNRCCKSIKNCPNRGCPAASEADRQGTALADAPSGSRLQVTANADLKTMEMGLYPGALISLVHNNKSEHNLIVAVHDQRFVIPRETAEQIIVKIRK
jgi:Fe2+ transport system protein FeoA